MVEELVFCDQLNFLVGPPNAGKTQWIRMLDFLLADPEPFFSRFPDENFTHYDAISAIVRIGKERFQFERFLHLDRMRTKVIVDGKAFDLMGFQHWLREKLQYPCVRYPKGSSSLKQAWPELSFRTLYRHMYRQQRFWSDLADRQTPIETSACLLQFMGLATEVYNEDLEKLRQLREKAEGHTVEIFACRMVLSILAGCKISEIPQAEELEGLRPKEIVSRLSDELSELEALIEGEPLAASSGTVFESSTTKYLLGLGQRIGVGAERLRLAKIIEKWLTHSEKRLKLVQREYWDLSSRIRAADLSDVIKARTDFLSGSMNEYLDVINNLEPNLWQHSDVRIRISRRNELKLCVGNMQWDRALGGSDSLLFLMAYHYGLLSLSNQSSFQYPGIVVVDFPAYFRGKDVSAIEGLVARPFADLLEREAFSTCQAIFIGSSFTGENRCHRIHVDTMYKH